MGMERFFLRRLRGEVLGQVLMTIGFALIFQDLALLIWGGDPYTVPIPKMLTGTVRVGGAVFPIFRIFIVAVAVVVGLALWLAMDRTRVGAMIRAAVDDAEMAQGVGINVPRVSLAVFALGAALAALGGVIGGGFLGVYPGADFEVLPYAFVVVIVGGLGSLPGAVAGSLLVGLLDNFGGALPRAVLFTLRPDGDHPGHPADRALRPRMIGRRALLAAVVVAVLALLGPWLPAYPLTVLTQALIVAILAMSLDVLLGYTGLSSLGHAAYFGVGAYVVAILATEHQMGLLTGLAAGVALATVTAAVFGLLAIRATGTYF
jgi:branched-subunit amino acid ABC-type transport system permease component